MKEQIYAKRTTVAGNSGAIIPVISEKGIFTPTNLVIPQKVAAGFFVTDVKVGRNSQQMSGASVHASFYTEEDRSEDLVFDTMQRGMLMTISVTNMLPTPQHFEAVVKGNLLENQTTKTMKQEASRVVLGLDHTLINPKGNVTISLQPQLAIRPEYIVVPLVVFEGVKVTSLRVVGVEVLSSEKLSPKDSPFCRFDFEAKAMQIGDWLCLDVENLTDEPQVIYGSIGCRLVTSQEGY